MLIVKKSLIKGAGSGLFTDKPIKKDTVLGIYSGKKLTSEGCARTKNKRYIWYICDNVYVDGNHIHKKSALLSYVNGAKLKSKKQKDSINCQAYVYRKNIYYKTLSNVKKGEELIVDYGKYYW